MHVRFSLGLVTLSLLSACQTAPPAAPAAPAAAAAPPAWQQGRTPDQATSTLAPVAGKLTVTPASEIPLQNFKLPPGFKAEI